MFSKHVWFDRKHQAEVFLTDDGIVGGTIVAYEGAVCLINPRPEILSILYSEAKIKRILSIKAVILTDNTMQYTRGLCALVAYSRGLRRRTPLTVITRTDTSISTDFLNSCCARLLNDSTFEVNIETVSPGQSYQLGKGIVRYVRLPLGASENPYVVVKTDKRMLHYFDETHTGAFGESHVTRKSHPNVVIRAAGLPQNPHKIIERVAVMA
jgi:hypothetical protein